MATVDPYQSFSHYYRALAGERQHFERQAALLRALLSTMSERARVLDAACGTGDVLSLLVADLPQRFSGCDGSIPMVTRALANPRLRGVPLCLCVWSELDLLFSHQGCFDLIAVLGNSVAHVGSVEDLQNMLRAVARGLAPRGELLLDVRRWTIDSASGAGVQNGRPPTLSYEFISDEQPVHVTESCSYSNGRQNIGYLLRSGISGVTLAEFTLSYLTFTFEQVVGWMQEAGFTHVQRYMPPEDYPYLVVSGRKAP